MSLIRNGKSSAKLSCSLVRERVRQLIQEIGAVLPDVTVHDITHVDALWRVAGEIAGGDYPLNPAEAFVLGGGFLLHDAPTSWRPMKTGSLASRKHSSGKILSRTDSEE